MPEYPKRQVKRMLLEQGEAAARALAAELGCRPWWIKQWFDGEWLDLLAAAEKRPAKPLVRERLVGASKQPAALKSLPAAPPRAPEDWERQSPSDLRKHRHTGRRVQVAHNAGLLRYNGGVGRLLGKTSAIAWPFTVKLDDGVVLQLDEWQFNFIEEQQ